MGPLCQPDREDAHFEPEVAGPDLSLYEHCALALDSGAATGVHGLPLMGGGDWNDGMNLVGRGGKGESVWLAWFQIAVLRRFCGIASRRDDSARAGRWAARIKELTAHVEAQAWDGLWYRRAYFDDGTPLGSASGTQCRIDSIAQSWAVISGAGDRQRAETAMDSALEHLYLPEARLMTLLAPAFDSPVPSPGYIAGYPPGVRENGGQYSHAAVWTLIALAELNRAQEMSAVLDALNPVLRTGTASASGAVSARAVRHARRHLFATAACRARRMELVHRRGGLVLPRGTRMGAGRANTRCDDRDQTLPAAAVVRLRRALPDERLRLPVRTRKKAR